MISLFCGYFFKHKSYEYFVSLLKQHRSGGWRYHLKILLSSYASPPQKKANKEMVRNIFRDSDIVNFYCIHVILLYGSVMLILR